MRIWTRTLLLGTWELEGFVRAMERFLHVRSEVVGSEIILHRTPDTKLPR